MEEFTDNLIKRTTLGVKLVGIGIPDHTQTVTANFEKLE